MRIGIVGAGFQGSTAALDLAGQEDVEEVRLADLDGARANAVAARAPAGRIVAGELDASRATHIEQFVTGLDVLISAASYRLHVALTRAAIAAGAHCCDLGGNNAVVDAQFQLDTAARRAGVTVIPDCGLAPGMASVLTALAVERHGAATSVQIRVGGIPLHPKPPLDYKLLFAPEGLINEYRESCRVLRGGEIIEVEPLSELEVVEFPPFGTLEAFHTSGGASTLPQTYQGRLTDLDYKTLRYPGHCERMRFLMDLGFMGERPVRIDGAEVVPRRLLEHLLGERLQDPEGDVTLLRVVAAGARDGAEVRHVFELIDRGDPERGFTAMMRTTAFPLAVVALLLGRERCQGPGVFAQEIAVPGAVFVQELRARGLDIQERREP